MEDGFGLIHELTEVKILLLFLLRHLAEPMGQEALTELALSCDGGITYFDVAECLSALLETEHVRLAGDEYAVTDKGARNGAVTESAVPYSVRVRALRLVSAARAAAERETLVRGAHELRREGGYTARLTLSDGVSEILALDLYAATEAQARELEDGFRRRAEEVYRAVLDTILLDEPPGE
jgi:hypothetical protein